MTNTKIAVGALADASLFLAACSTDPSSSESDAGTDSSTTPSAATPAVTTATTAAEAPESRSAEPRLAISHDGGVMVLDAGDLGKGEAPKVVADLPAEG